MELNRRCFARRERSRHRVDRSISKAQSPPRPSQDAVRAISVQQPGSVSNVEVMHNKKNLRGGFESL